MVVIRPETMPYFSSSTCAIGARQLVVQEAQLMTVSVPSRIFVVNVENDGFEVAGCGGGDDDAFCAGFEMDARPFPCR